MKKQTLRLAVFLLLLSLTLGIAPAAQAADAVSAQAGSVTIALGGGLMRLGTYNIAGNNYVKLRDVAQLLQGSDKSFGITWNAGAQRIDLSPWEDYTSVGGELAPLAPGTRTAAPSAASVQLYGAMLPLTAYTIDNNNFFRLRDLGAALDFCVDWDGSRIIIDPDRGYQAPAGGASATSDGELMVLASRAGNVMKDSIYGVNLGAILGQSWEGHTTINGRECYPVPGYSSMAELDSYWHQSFARKYSMDEVTGGEYRNWYLESNGVLYSLNQGIGSDLMTLVVDEMVSRSADEAVFRGREVFEDDGFDDEIDPIPVEFSLVYENGTWMYGYYRTTP